MITQLHHRRFGVLSTGDQATDHDYSVTPQTETEWDWCNCKPNIKAYFTNPGTIEVFWEPPNSFMIGQINECRVLLNGVSYCKRFPGLRNSIKVVGLAGGRVYNIFVEVFHKSQNREVLESNILQLTCRKEVQNGSPLISQERTQDRRVICVVWMSIDRTDLPISGYLLFVNDHQCGHMLIPESDSNRCKMVVSGCDDNSDYKIYVIAICAETDKTLMSNVLVVRLPLDTSNITLPPHDKHIDNAEIYQEYITVMEGSGYLPESEYLHGSGCVDRAPTVHPIESQYVMLDASSNETRNITQQNASNLSLADEPSLQGHRSTLINKMAIVDNAGSGKEFYALATTAAIIEVQRSALAGEITDNNKHEFYGEGCMVRVREGEFVRSEFDGVLPAPIISATTLDGHRARIVWEQPKEFDSQYQLLLCVVNVVGHQFSTEINSDIR